jgi:hypothetical protein
MGLLDDKKKSQYLQMAEEKLQGLLNIPQQAQRFITNPTAFLGLLGQNPLPRESGFAAGATGLPPTEMSVLDPNQAPYMQGYGQGEPVGYAGMALPFAAPAAVATGRALAPKAGQAIEGYMVNQGLLQPLTAYHGTPHTIQGKFDINKVGTGEGNQAYGYGMYFAENPAVAGEYQKRLSADSALGYQAKDIDPAYINAANSFKEFGSNYEETLKGLKQAYKNAPEKELDIAAKVAFQPTGNLYKVDIPDADIPNMLDWDKPLAQQNKQVLEGLKKLNDPYINKAISSQPKLSKDGEYWEYMGNTYGSKSEALEDATPHRIITGYTGLGETPADVSKALNSVGIKGISYLDQGSRIKGQGSRNFVVFDPSTVKILEKNKKKVEGLLD